MRKSNSKLLRTVLSMVVVIAIMASLGVAAFATYSAEFKFSLPDCCEVEDVILECPHLSISIKTKLPELFAERGGRQIAEDVAYDRFLNGCSYAYLLDTEKHTVTFPVGCPTLVVIPATLQAGANGDVPVYVIAVDIPDGTEVTCSLKDPNGNEVASLKGVVDDQLVKFILPKGLFDGAKPGDEYTLTIEAPGIDGNGGNGDGSGNGNHPSNSGKRPYAPYDGNKGNGGNGNGNGNNGNGNGNNGNGNGNGNNGNNGNGNGSGFPWWWWNWGGNGQGGNGGNGQGGNGGAGNTSAKNHSPWTHGVKISGFGYEAGAEWNGFVAYPIGGQTAKKELPNLSVWFFDKTLNLPLYPWWNPLTWGWQG